MLEQTQNPFYAAVSAEHFRQQITSSFIVVFRLEVQTDFDSKFKVQQTLIVRRLL